MASPNGTTTDSLIEQLKEHPQTLDFFWAVRCLQSRHPEKPRVGCAQRLEEEIVRFGQIPALDFAPSTVSSYGQSVDGRPPRLGVRFMGLLGPGGPMPLCVTEYAVERELHHRDKTLTAFLDIFHHRMIALFFRAWAAGQKCVDADRPHQERFVEYIGSLCGLGMESLRQRDALTDWSKLFFAGRLAAQARNAEGLEQIVADYFGLPTEVRCFVGRWLPLPVDSQCRLGQSPSTGTLGMSVIVGDQYWDCQMSFCIHLGPMRLADYERMLPGGDSFRRLECWVLNYVGQELFWSVHLVLLKEEVPETRLGQAGRLGFTTWLKTKPFVKDADDLVVLCD